MAHAPAEPLLGVQRELVLDDDDDGKDDEKGKVDKEGEGEPEDEALREAIQNFPREIFEGDDEEEKFPREIFEEDDEEEHCERATRQAGGADHPDRACAQEAEAAALRVQGAHDPRRRGLDPGKRARRGRHKVSAERV